MNVFIWDLRCGCLEMIDEQGGYTSYHLFSFGENNFLSVCEQKKKKKWKKKV